MAVTVEEEGKEGLGEFEADVDGTCDELRVPEDEEDIHKVPVSVGDEMSFVDDGKTEDE